MMNLNQSSRSAVAGWLGICCVLVFCMVVLGGVTRLTDSGLSMVRWEPISGMLPPLTQTSWQAEFEHYRKFPEYQKINAGMPLDAFKRIFYFEYAHRMLGRLIGLADQFLECLSLQGSPEPVLNLPSADLVPLV